MSDKYKIADDIDIDGLWYWIQNRYYRRYATEISPALLKKAIKLADLMDDIEKEFEQEKLIHS